MARRPAKVWTGTDWDDIGDPSKVLKTGDTITGPTVVDVNSSSDALRITQTGAGNALLVEDSANPDATPFVVDANGRVIVGHTTNVDGYTLQSATSGGAGFSSQRYSNDSGAAFVRLSKSRGAVGANSSVSSGDGVGIVQFRAADGSSYVTAAQIEAVVDGTPGTNDMPGRLVFSTTADGASTPTERMRINSAGLITGTGTSLGAWTAYTPTLTNWTQGNGTVVGYFAQIGKVVHFRARFVFGSTSSAAGVPNFTLPVTALNGAGQTLGGVVQGSFFDASLGSVYKASARFTTTTTCGVRIVATDGLEQIPSATTPFTWASNDVVNVFGTYEAA